MKTLERLHANMRSARNAMRVAKNNLDKTPGYSLPLVNAYDKARARFVSARDALMAWEPNA